MNIDNQPLYIYQTTDGWRIGVLSRKAWRRAITAQDDMRAVYERAYDHAGDALAASDAIIARLAPHMPYKRRIEPDEALPTWGALRAAKARLASRVAV